MRTVLALLLLSCLALAAEHAEVYDGSVLAGWVIPPPAQGAALAVQGGAVVWTYERQRDAKLLHAVLLTEFVEIRLRARSAADAVLGLVVPDREGRAFHRLFRLPAGAWTTVRTRAGDFQAGAAAGAGASLDPRQVGAGYLLLDRSPGRGPNRVEIDEATVVRSLPPRRTGLWSVDEDVTVSESVFRDAATLVGDGARLRIEAPQVRLGGPMWVQDAAVEVEGATLHVPQRFNHERKIHLRGESRLALRRATVVTDLPLSLELDDAAVLDVADTTFVGGITCPVRAGCRVRLEDVRSPGEFIVLPGSEVAATRTQGVLLWLAAAQNLTGTLSLPAGDRVDAWDADRGWRVRLRDCTRVLWGLVSLAGSDATFRDTTFRAVGLHFGGRGDVGLRDIHNGAPPEGGGIDTGDRVLRFVDSPVETWNVYTSLRARLTLQRSTIGEVIAFMTSEMEIEDCRIDGTGGYVSTHAQSRMTLRDCEIDCLVVARDASTIVLERCRVRGDVRATGHATVLLVDSTVEGRVEADPDATVERR